MTDQPLRISKAMTRSLPSFRQNTGGRSGGSLLLIAILMTGAIQVNLYGATFRVTTKVYAGPTLKPSAEHLILFQEGLIYDFPQIESRYVTIFDLSQKLVTLMDRETQVQASVSVDDLIKICAQARAAAKTEEQRTQLGINAKVETSTKVQGYRLRFANLDYQLTGQQPEKPAVAAEFAKFVDLAARLNLVRRLGPPPFGRMTLNQHLAERKEIPLETTLTLTRGDEKLEYRSTHELEELTALPKANIEKIEEAIGMRAIYRQVNLKEFP